MPACGTHPSQYRERRGSRIWRSCSLRPSFVAGSALASLTGRAGRSLCATRASQAQRNDSRAPRAITPNAIASATTPRKIGELRGPLRRAREREKRAQPTASAWNNHRRSMMQVSPRRRSRPRGRKQPLGSGTHGACHWIPAVPPTAPAGRWRGSGQSANQ